MKTKNFKTSQNENGDTIIERLVYPKFYGRITFGNISDIEDFEWENANEIFEKEGKDAPKIMAMALTEAADFLLRKHKK